ncbi:ATP-grasp domain-containing protein [Streptomyces zingiberis]|uniref:ATP-grasp domain-containing protein n=1 Tax=Streptomyces zingiberis TaxID=2053010 RepID=A0ABX1BVF0_9ACTN|nr:ATP-grasp domain-containing protein [Streptomyces zingiberis]NJQ00418.1 ATP-grasp domain-containing protein [Streptomyces zingiberis]
MTSTAHSANAGYLLVFGAATAMRERALVAAVREFDGPVATIARRVGTPAAKFFDHVLIGDFSDPDSAVRATEEFRRETGMVPAGVVPFFDPGLLPGWAVARRWGLPYLSREAVEDSSVNKDRMKDRLLAAGVATPRHRRVTGPDEAAAACEEFGLPCVVKPAGFGGSLGVRLISDRAEVPAAYAAVRRVIEEHSAVFTVRNHRVQVEEFCPLEHEVSVEVLNHLGRRVVLGVADKSLGPRPHFAELGHRVPSVFSGRADVRDLALRACAAIGLDHGMAHVEIKVGRGGPPSVVEVGARTAGDGICDLVELALGISPGAWHIRSYLHRIGELPVPPEPSGTAAMAVLKAPPGRITEVRAPRRLPTAVRHYELFAAAGAVSHSPAHYLHREGYAECFWPGTAPEELPPDAHLVIARELTGQIFRTEPAGPAG